MLSNKNNLRSELTANVGVLATSISITAGEGVLWENNMVACLEHYENDICTKREVIKITAKNNDTFTITRGFADCIMNDQTKQQGHGSQEFVVGDYLSLYLSKEIWESLTVGITTNETNIQTMVARINAPKTCINNNCQDWKDAIDTAYVTKFGGIAGFGTGADGDVVISQDTFLDAGCEYNFNNLTILEGVTVRFQGVGTPTINVWNNFKNFGTIDMRAPYLQARTDSQTDHWLHNGTSVANQSDSLTGIASEGGLYKGGAGGGGTSAGCDASDGHGGNGGSGAPYDGINGGAGGTSGSYGTGGGGAFGMGTGGAGGTGACNGGNGGNGFYGGRGGDVTMRSRFDGGGGAGGKGVIRGGDAGGGTGGCDYNTFGNGGDAITNVYGLHLNARNIWNNLVDASGGDGGNGGIYYWSGTSGGYAPSGGNGGNGANGGQILVSYDTIHEQGCFDVSGGKGGIGAKIGFSSETYWRYEQPNGTDGTAGWVVFKSLNNPYIQNFNLENDEDNEAILISWKDPSFKPSNPQQWAKTVVRYSTSNYPTTPTDGTLAVEETTKDLYETTPYSLTGVLDETTYYFSIFALDQNNTIIDVQTKSIETDFVFYGYQRVSWIGTTGTQWINTGLFAYNYYQTEVKIEVSTTTQNIPIFGTYPNNSASTYYHLTPFSSKFYFGRNNVENNAGTYNATIGQQYTITFNNSNSRLIVNNVDIASTSGTVGAPNTTLTISRRGGTSQSVYYGQFKYFYFKMFNKNTGKYDREMYPVYRKSDNVIGMFDIVNKVFYTNAGSGTFTKGPDVN